MMNLDGRRFAVAGGTGNVGGFVVEALLERGATVVVPSRSERKLEELRSFLSERERVSGRGQLVTMVADLSDDSRAQETRSKIEEEVGTLEGALASLGTWRSAPSLISAAPADLEAVLQGYLLAHFRVARVLVPALEKPGGSYVSINGPLAFDVWPGSGAAFVSVATAGQHMLFKALAHEFEGSGVRVNELVSHAFIRNHTTQKGSPLQGEDVGVFAAHLLSNAPEVHGETVQLRSPQQLRDIEGGVLEG